MGYTGHPRVPRTAFGCDGHRQSASLLPAESAEDYAAQLLPVLTQLAQIEQGVWGRAKQIFQSHLKTL